MRDLHTFQPKKPHKKAMENQLGPSGCSGVIHNGVEDMSIDVYVGFLLKLHKEDGSGIVDSGQLLHWV